MRPAFARYSPLRNVPAPIAPVAATRRPPAAPMAIYRWSCRSMDHRAGRLVTVAQTLGTTEGEGSHAGVAGSRTRALILVVFFASGFAGLVYEVMFAKSLALVFGSTATAATTVLATYMGGMSLGLWLGGRVATRASAPLKVYAACEAGIALTCALAPFGFGLLRSTYVALARGVEPGEPSLVLLQVALGAAFLLPPTMLMGATLPLLAKQLAADMSGLGRTGGGPLRSKHARRGERCARDRVRAPPDAWGLEGYDGRRRAQRPGGGGRVAVGAWRATRRGWPSRCGGASPRYGERRSLPRVGGSRGRGSRHAGARRGLHAPPCRGRGEQRLRVLGDAVVLSCRARRRIRWSVADG